MSDLELFPFPHSLGNVWKLINKITKEKEDIVIITEGIVKYLPSKYNKITISLENIKEFQNYELLFKTDLSVEPFLKGDTISLKIDNDMKQRTKELTQGVYLKLAIKFNGVWKVSGKLYASWELVDYKIQEKPKIRYFD